jgi:hypothetical protein
MKEAGIGDPLWAPRKRTSSFETPRLRAAPQDEVLKDVDHCPDKRSIASS